MLSFAICMMYLISYPSFVPLKDLAIASSQCFLYCFFSLFCFYCVLLQIYRFLGRPLQLFCYQHRDICFWLIVGNSFWHLSVFFFSVHWHSTLDGSRSYSRKSLWWKGSYSWSQCIYFSFEPLSNICAHILISLFVDSLPSQRNLETPGVL